MNHKTGERDVSGPAQLGACVCGKKIQQCVLSDIDVAFLQLVENDSRNDLNLDVVLNAITRRWTGDDMTRIRRLAINADARPI